jgi:hypothetical protein
LYRQVLDIWYRQGTMKFNYQGQILGPLGKEWRHDTQHNNNQHNDTQHKDNQYNDNQHNDTQHNDNQHNSK